MEDRKDRILAFMKEESYRPLLIGELSVVLDVPKSDREELLRILNELEEEGKIFRTHKDRYGIPERMSLMTGRIQGNERGFGFLIPDDDDQKDVFIPANSLNGAMHNDRVIVKMNRDSSENKRSEGEVIKIIKRANETIVGTFESSRYFGFVVPDNQKLPGDIFIPKDEFNGAQQGQKVVARIVKWPDKRRNAEGVIEEVIGDKDEVGVDIVSIIKAHNFSETFPEEVLNEAEFMPEAVTEKMLKERRDLRALRMVTIDGEDAKDLDDAVSIERLPGSKYRLGVHIADVSHYVTENSQLDREAYKRGTSVYLVDRVLPMLPKQLSNGICSLNPKVDRLAFSVIMEVDSAGRVYDHEVFESVIRTSERMTYTDVYKILEENDAELIKKYDYLVDDFKSMKELAMILRKKRFDRGAVDFDFEEAKIMLDEKGKPVEIKRYEITIANKIIEEFMLLCNETVAEHFFWANSPFVYRVHEDPDIEKVEAFNEFVHNLGYHIKGVNKIHPRAFQDLLEKVKGTKHERIISTVMLRSMQKARYLHQNLGHFGLAAKYYSHFTSPIRRYPDLMIHRIMKEQLKGKMNEKREAHFNKILPEVSKQCSERERASEEAERETEDLKKVEYMKQHEGEIFEGIISNIMSFGMFVELDNTVEGLIRLSSMDDDYYIYDEKQYMLLGERTRKIYRIGDSIRVILARADIQSRQIDFVPAEEEYQDERLGEASLEDYPKAREGSKKTAKTSGYLKEGKGKKASGNGKAKRPPEEKKSPGKKEKGFPQTESGEKGKRARKGSSIPKSVKDHVQGKGGKKKRDKGEKR